MCFLNNISLQMSFAYKLVNQSCNQTGKEKEIGYVKNKTKIEINTEGMYIN